ncbi:MAG TPA: nucleotidyltransferase domain-containing protein [Flavisolibacter sp.]|nr:nucleotidyltransferase domain-containing protein [Flavisolibacter sp.]
MKQLKFAEHAVSILKLEQSVIGLAAGGSLLSNELDEYSDIDLVLVTKEKISDSKEKMMQYAHQLGKVITAFTGDHVGEPRLLICLYDNPLLHVDIKFVTLEEFKKRVEDPVILLDNNNQLTDTIASTVSAWPHPEYQWIEDRIWTFVHYALLKIGRGEYFEALDFLSFLRTVVLGPLLHIKNDNQPRGVRKVETKLPSKDFEKLEKTVAINERQSLLTALHHIVKLYRELRMSLYDSNVVQHHEAEHKVMEFYDKVKNGAH